MIGFVLLFLIVIIGTLGLLVGLKQFGVLRQPDRIPGEGPTRGDLHRLEEALSALDARLERVEDQQRFLERLLEARPEPRSLPAGGEGEGAGADAAGERGVDSVLFDVEREER